MTAAAAALLWLVALVVLASPAMFFLCCCACLATITVQVRGCNAIGLDGESVTITQGGSTVATGTTAGGGYVEFELPVGSYSASVATPTGFQPLAAEAFTVAAGCDPQSVTLSLAVDDDAYVCCPTSARPIPMDLTYTDANGSQAATFVDLGTSKYWQVCYTVTKTGLRVRDFLGNCDGTTSADIAVQAKLECTSGYLRATLTYYATGCLIGAFVYCSIDPLSTCVDLDGIPFASGTDPIEIFPSASTNSFPTSYSGTWPSASTEACADGNIATPVSGTFTWAP